MAETRQGPAPPLPRAGRPAGARAADRAVHVARPLARPAVQLSRRAARRPRPDRLDRADQGDRPLRRQPRRRADDVRDAEHHRRDQASLPRPRLGGPRAARPPGAERPAVEARRAADRRARPLADDRRARRRRRASTRRTCSRRSSRAAPTRRSRSRRAAAPRTARSSIRSSRSATIEPEYEVSEDRAVLAPGFKVLDARERMILHLRFFEGLTQSQIAQQVGISQMHVSRLIRRALEKIRDEIAADEPIEPRIARPPQRPRQPPPYTVRRAHDDGRAARGASSASTRSAGICACPAHSLIPPADDPSTLFIVAGMQQFKPYFLRTKEPPSNRVVSVQKCLRAGGKDTDLDDVGRTDRHCSFFEMMGNFSFGDYFKDEAVDFAWEFVTERARRSSPSASGRPSTRATRCSSSTRTRSRSRPGSASASRPSGSSGSARTTSGRRPRPGPCGQCSEIFYDRGEQYACGDPTCGPGHCDRYMEIYNLVFMEYDLQPGNELVPLPTPERRHRPRRRAHARACSRTSTRSSTPTASS